ncbi:MAG TPA: transglutaminaseTgpA domain-containing protein [Bacillales bacterium]|nr:transglutaminaseTgpA domain-containing protein [Bacillales bacterium]
MQRTDHWFMTLLLYVLGFLLFWEWLRPLSVITNTGDLNVFVMYTAFAFLLSYLQLPFWITTPAKILAMLYALHSLFFFDSFLDPGWLVILAEDAASNVGLLFGADWSQLSNLFRSLLFFVLLWLVSYLMHYWLIQARRVFLFFLVTVLYVTIIDTFTPYDATAAIVRTVLIGFVLLGILRFIKLKEEERVSAGAGRFPLSWAAAMVVILLVMTAVGFAAPKVDAQWPDPVPFLKSHYGKGGPGIQRIGYGTDDSHLGGPFKFDDSPVFTAATKESRYWRVETKSIYTGKGWKIKNSNQMELIDPETHAAPVLYDPEVKTNKIQAVINLAKGRKFPQLVYGGELAKAEMPKDVQLKMNVDSEKIRMVQGGDNISLPSYKMTLEVPEFSIEKLSKPIQDTSFARNHPKYTELPDSLPDRVKRLTMRITKDAGNRYEKAVAVEDYLHSDKFKYKTKHVAVPGKNQDYVAQFLFDTQRGYCDNFSSAMAVMLRTIGIPTRWVKGFSPGDYLKTLKDGKTVYQVTNANAHSWVEVYFPGSGWVPFEPTKGFLNSFNVAYRQVNTDNGSDSVDAISRSPQTNKRLASPNKPHPGSAASSGGGGNGLNSGRVKTLWSIAAVLLVILAIAAWIIYKTRKKWLPRWIRARILRKNRDDVLGDAYERLLKLLPVYGMTRSENQTLREYAVAVDMELGTGEMKGLTSNYEKLRYRGDRSDELWQTSKAQWEALIERLMSYRNQD